MLGRVVSEEGILEENPKWTEGAFRYGAKNIPDRKHQGKSPEVGKDLLHSRSSKANITVGEEWAEEKGMRWSLRGHCPGGPSRPW